MEGVALVPGTASSLTTNANRMQRNLAIVTNGSWNLLNFRKELLSALTEAGYQLHLIVPDPKPELEEFGTVHRLDMHPTSMNPRTEAFVCLKLRSLLAKINPAVVLTYTIKPNVYGAIAARSLGIPVICNVTGLGEAFGGSRLKRFIAEQLYRRSVAKAEIVFVQNGDDYNFLLERQLVPKAVLRLVPGSGVNTKLFSPSHYCQERVPGQPFRFLFVGRLREDKGFLDYCQAAQKLRASGVDATFAAVGQLERGRRTSVSQRDLDQLVQQQVILHKGFVDNVRPEIEAADCVVLPSYREGLPRALLEAASMQKPLIATDVPGCRELVIDEVTGLLCQVRDSNSLADAMQRMTQMSPFQRQILGQGGRRLVEEKYDVRLVINAYLSSIEEILGAPSQDGAWVSVETPAERVAV